MDGRRENDAAAAGVFGGDHDVVHADDIGLEEHVPGGGGIGRAGHVDDGVDAGAEFFHAIEVGNVGGYDFAKSFQWFGFFIQLMYDESELVLVRGVLGEVGADISGGAGDEKFSRLAGNIGAEGTGAFCGKGFHGLVFGAKCVPFSVTTFRCLATSEKYDYK